MHIFLVINCIHYTGAIALFEYYTTSVWSHHIIDLNCTGAEDDILNCSYNGLIDSYTCPPSHDASVICLSESL